MLRRRLWLCVVLIPLAFPLAAQQVASDVPQEWQADAKANKHAQKAAEKAADKAAPPMKGAGPDAAGNGGGPPGGGMGGQGGGAGGPPPGGGEGGPPGGGGPGGGGGSRVTADVMLRPEMDFAAPLKGTLVLYRSRDAVVFGSKESQDVVILPLSGEAVPIAPGVTATVHDEAGALRVQIDTSNDIHVTYHYGSESGALTVTIHAEGPVPRPGSRFDVVRRYRLAQSGH